MATVIPANSPGAHNKQALTVIPAHAQTLSRFALLVTLSAPPNLMIDCLLPFPPIAACRRPTSGRKTATRREMQLEVLERGEEAVQGWVRGRRVAHQRHIKVMGRQYKGG